MSHCIFMTAFIALVQRQAKMGDFLGNIRPHELFRRLLFYAYFNHA